MIKFHLPTPPSRRGKKEVETPPNGAPKRALFVLSISLQVRKSSSGYSSGVIEGARHTRAVVKRVNGKGPVFFKRGRT